MPLVFLFCTKVRCTHSVLHAQPLVCSVHATARTKGHATARATQHVPPLARPSITTRSLYFLRREGDLVEFFIARCNQQLLRELQAMQADGRLSQISSIRARLAMALRLRLQMIEPYIDSWPQVCVGGGGGGVGVGGGGGVGVGVGVGCGCWVWVWVWVLGVGVGVGVGV